MRHAQILISTGLSAAGLLVAGCGATRQATSAGATTSTQAAAGSESGTLAARVAPARIGFISPRRDARVGPNLRVHVRLSHRGQVRFILDTGRPRLSDTSTVIYRHLAPGLHRLEAQLLVAPGHPPAATAIVHFRVRPPAPKPAVLAPLPATTTAAPPPAPPQVTTATPPPQTSTAMPPPTSTAPAAPPPTTGIPQGGGGDGDGDNSGAPSDGDGNI
ncbi:MAG TPA: hypothetical protein VG371_00695 [Solirubrobacteraceae bacterium]|nr:hypothetical protein [Solirubrobacteraceae bacterium]